MSDSSKGRYYFRVPEEMQARLVRDIQRSRLRSVVLYFPLLLLIGTGAVILAVLTKGHAIIYWARELAGPEVSDRQVWTALALIAAGLAAIGLIVLLWLMYREPLHEVHLFCQACQAADSDDAGACPVCQHALVDRSHFIYTQSTDEQKLLSRRGLEGWRGA